MAASRVMLVSPQRVIYRGLLGEPKGRVLGGLAIYAALDQPFSITLHNGVDAGQTQLRYLALVPPWVAHDIRSSERQIVCMVIDAHAMTDASMHALLAWGTNPLHAQTLRDSVLHGVQTLEDIRQLVGLPGDQPSPGALSSAQLDACLLPLQRDAHGRAGFPFLWQARLLDHRIQRVVDAIVDAPQQELSAVDAAARCHLSVSRFLHLFRDEVGMPFRRFRAWRRARSVLHVVNQPVNLTHVALDAGYPDATHFCHTIRQFYGLRPRDLFSGSRRLQMLGT